MNKTLFRVDKFKVVRFDELKNGDFFVLDGELYMKQCDLAVSISSCDENGDYEHFTPDAEVTKAISFIIARL